MAHVNGFFFGTTASPALAGTPLVPTGTPTAGTLTFPPTAHVKSVHFFKTSRRRGPQPDDHQSPVRSDHQRARDADRRTYTAQSPAISQPGFLPGLTILNEMMTITTSTAAGTGILNMPMNFSTQVGVQIGPVGALSRRPTSGPSASSPTS